MKVITKVVIDIATGGIISEKGYNYKGPAALAKGGSSPPPPAPPPSYAPPPPPEPPPVYVPPPSPYDEANKEELEKAKKKISSQARGRSSTILTGLLTEAPATQKTKLKGKLGE